LNISFISSKKLRTKNLIKNKISTDSSNFFRVSLQDDEAASYRLIDYVIPTVLFLLDKLGRWVPYSFHARFGEKKQKSNR